MLFSLMTYSKYDDMQSKINYTFVRLNVSMLVKIGLVRVSTFSGNCTQIFFNYTFSLY